jgi:NAD(P)-dependent dehydrogenase (short-subunit alcohol dehydrogenase family)
MHAVFIGASKGIGYMTLNRYLASDPSATATLVLRKPELAKQDKQLGSYIAAGRVSFVKGDATDLNVVQEAMKGDVDFVMTSVGELPTKETEEDARIGSDVGADDDRSGPSVHVDWYQD